MNIAIVMNVNPLKAILQTDFAVLGVLQVTPLLCLDYLTVTVEACKLRQLFDGRVETADGGIFSKCTMQNLTPELMRVKTGIFDILDSGTLTKQILWRFPFYRSLKRHSHDIDNSILEIMFSMLAEPLTKDTFPSRYFENIRVSRFGRCIRRLFGAGHRGLRDDLKRHPISLAKDILGSHIPEQSTDAMLPATGRYWV